MQAILVTLADNSPAVIAALLVVVLMYHLNSKLSKEMLKEMHAMRVDLLAEMTRRDERTDDRFAVIQKDIYSLKESVAKLVATVDLLKDWHPANPKNQETLAESPPPYNQK